MRSLATLIWSTARPSLTGPGLACVAAAASVGCLCFVQESAALRRLGLEFSWGSCRDTVIAVTLAYCVADSLRWLRERDRWELRTAPRPLFHTLVRILASFLGACFVTAASTLIIITLERILVGSSPGSPGWTCMGQALLLAVPLAAWAPAVAGVSDRLDLPRTVVWALTIATSCGILGPGIPLPLDRLPPLGDGGTSWWAGLVPACTLSAAAGVCVTAAVIPVPFPQTPPCGSASSATSTATSKH
jgi:hypothetical protein